MAEKTKRIALYNTLKNKKERFVSIHENKVGMYTCGPTVYHYAHIGNLRTYIFEDILKRLFIKAGYDINHVMNITDVGHLQSDEDEGEDKISLAAVRDKKDPWQIAKFYQDAFLNDYNKLGLQIPNIICKATDHIPDMIEAIQNLLKKDFAYVTEKGNVYFDTMKFPGYANFAKLKLDHPEKNRVEIDTQKRNTHDFVLWFSQSKYPNQIMKWDSPWGIGFPGWHIECSVMAMKYLGPKLDIHCGGIDHIPVHHTNEIAQSEALLGHKWTNYWLHCEFLTLNSEKMSKSSGKFITLDDLIKDGFEPVHYRFFCLNSHYRTNINFSTKLLDLARGDFESLKNRIITLKKSSQTEIEINNEELIQSYKIKYWNIISDDMNTKGTIEILRELIKDNNLSSKQKISLLSDFDEILGLGIDEFEPYELNAEQQRMICDRIIAKKSKKWEISDAIRDNFKKQGIILNDESDGSTTWYPIRISQIK
jgi:cysteinyl-tRNA synthetase